MEHYGNNDWRDYQEDNYLAHYGVKGMKWGKTTGSRGAINADGSNTERVQAKWTLLGGAPLKPKGTARRVARSNSTPKPSSGGWLSNNAAKKKKKTRDSVKSGPAPKRKMRIGSNGVKGASGKIGTPGKKTSSGGLFSNYKKKKTDTLKKPAAKKRGIRARIAALFGR